MNNETNETTYEQSSMENSKRRQVLIVGDIAGHLLQSKLYNIASTLDFEALEVPELASEPLKQKKEGYIPSKRDVFNRRDRKRWIKQMRGK